MNKFILYIATSHDGYIADSNGAVDWLPHPKDDEELATVGYHALMSRIDVIVMGSTSYKQIIGFGDWAWQDKQTYVLSSKAISTENPAITITQETPLSLASKLRSRQGGKDIWLLGGAKLAQSFAQADLIDEMVLTIVPQTLGAGIPLAIPFENFNLLSQKSLMDGMVQKQYLRK